MLCVCFGHILIILEELINEEDVLGSGYFVLVKVILSQIAYHYIKAEKIESSGNTVRVFIERIEELERQLRNKE